MINTHIYACIFKYEDGEINISFPDFDGALTCATTEKEALEHAKEVLGMTIFAYEEERWDLPKGTLAKDVKVGKNETVQLIEV